MQNVNLFLFNFSELNFPQNKHSYKGPRDVKAVLEEISYAKKPYKSNVVNRVQLGSADFEICFCLKNIALKMFYCL